jgi:hypothetical protein
MPAFCEPTTPGVQATAVTTHASKLQIRSRIAGSKREDFLYMPSCYFPQTLTLVVWK